MRTSLYTLYILFVFYFVVGFFYYPKYNKYQTESTISWDISGYYLYLPAVFIYKDLSHLGFKDSLTSKYVGSGDQAFQVANGNWVMKYPAGLAICYLPAFAVGHFAANILGYPADGFSLPYQFCLHSWSFLVGLLGLWLLRRLLLRYFSDSVTAILLVIFALCTNYLEYGVIQSSYAHNYLFTLYILLILSTKRWYHEPNTKASLAVGCIIGLLTLIRPTEVIGILVFATWGLSHQFSIRNRFSYWLENKQHLLTMALAFFSFLAIQLFYWKLVAGSWIVYSYGDQSFSWLHPHVLDCLFDFKAGWLVYSPIFLLALSGVFLAGSRKTFLVKEQIKGKTVSNWPIYLFLLLFSYITFAWDIWNYGGGVSLRAMMQSYPFWAFPMGYTVERLLNGSMLKSITLAVIISFCAYYNLWLHHQAHWGGLLYAGNMTKAYYWRTVLKYQHNVDPLAKLLLDNKYDYQGEKKNVKQIYFNNFENDTSCLCLHPIEGTKSLCISPTIQFTPVIKLPIKETDANYLRVSADFLTTQKEWIIDKMPTMVAVLMNGNEIAAYHFIRMQRVLEPNIRQNLHLDAKLHANKPHDHLDLYFWNVGSNNIIAVDNLKVETFDTN